MAPSRSPSTPPCGESGSNAGRSRRIAAARRTRRAALGLVGCAFCLLLGACHRRAPLPADPALVSLVNAHDTIRDAPHKYVVRGRNDHLFYLEDLRAAVGRWAFLDSNVSMIGRLAAELRGRGIRLIVLPVPTKVETYPELLGGRDTAQVSASKGLFLRALAARGVQAVDLRGAFFAAKRAKRLFCKTDTHWDEDAIRIAADSLGARLGMPAAPAARTIADTVIEGFRGDLADKFQAPDIHGVTDTIRVARVRALDGGPWAEPDSAAVILYGDSFLNQYKRLGGHLGAHLSSRLGTPVRTIYSLAGFTRGPDKILEIAAANPGAKTIVWVFTSRTLMDAAR